MSRDAAQFMNWRIVPIRWEPAKPHLKGFAAVTTNVHQPMTITRLRKHLFGGVNVPFWAGDPSRLTAGVEIEYFIAHAQGDTFRLATEAEYRSVIDHLSRDYRYVDRQLPDQPGRVSRDTESGFITIKPDFAWHILEISFPPRANTNQLRDLLTSVTREVDDALARVGLCRLDLSCLSDPPAEMDFVPLDRLAGSQFQPPDPDCPTNDPRLPAYLTATHVHLNISDESALRTLPQLFALEPLAMAMYARAHEFRGRRYDNVRTELYADTLGRDYPLINIPNPVPASLEDLVNAMNRGKPIFPNDRFFPVRNMSYIRPTRIGTFEFRSACSHWHVEALLEIALWRKVQATAVGAVGIPIHDDWEKRLASAMNALSKAGEDQKIIDTIAARVDQHRALIPAAPKNEQGRWNDAS